MNGAPESEAARDAGFGPAAAEAAAAEAVLLDRRCEPSAALPHLVLGWRRLLAALGREAAEADLERALGAAPLPGLAPELQQEAAAGIGALVRSNAALRDGAADAALGRAAGRRQAWLLRRAVKAAQRAGRRSRLPKGLRVGLAAIVPVALIAVGLLLPRGGGWRARYYDGLQLSHPALERRDPAILFRWGEGAPAPVLPADGFAARWDACLDLDAPTRLEFVLGSDDGSRLFVDDAQVIDNWKSQPLHWMSRELDLGPGAHHLRVEYYDKTGDATIELEIRRPGHPPRPLSQRSLRPTHGETDACGS